ncbi:ParB N-terminal domain-containing protein [Sulfitobacter sp. D35]|uniref:ParB/RepB/Spo0J family partition protein n=1 Tax=Sulfitobacter sp. D35 TaxID=3083252 RepID=UPI00296FB5C4|nr:ParB N-terminal domain-containing protein [Sulfitobacter sp. D35]MDW4499253.1 ParB N-terminal domain-containing protein [Sulfitobacter sp. D35]
MSKRRVFDIDFEDSEPDVPAGTEAERRRGPMAAAISENAEALADRQSAEAAIRAENDRLAHEYVALKKNGQIVGLVDVAAIRAEKLIRDRSAAPDPELHELKESIRVVGLSNPIHVEETEAGYELIQGFRRLTAFRELFAETKDARYAKIPAVLVARGVQLDNLYRRMVDENLVRRDISFAEMAQLAISYGAVTDLSKGTRDAVDVLFASAGRQKRSYIRHFMTLIERLGAALNHPEAIPRATGLALVKAMEGDARLAGRIVAVLESRPQRNAADEVGILREAVSGAGKAAKKAGARPAQKSGARTTIRLNRPEGVAKCTASSGRFEVQLDRDFGAVDPRRLEVAARAFLDALK